MHALQSEFGYLGFQYYHYSWEVNILAFYWKRRPLPHLIYFQPIPIVGLSPRCWPDCGRRELPNFKKTQTKRGFGTECDQPARPSIWIGQLRDGCLQIVNITTVFVAGGYSKLSLFYSVVVTLIMPYWLVYLILMKTASFQAPAVAIGTRAITRTLSS